MYMCVVCDSESSSHVRGRADGIVCSVGVACTGLGEKVKVKVKVER